MNAIVPVSAQPSNVEVFRQSTDAANLCKDIVVATAKKIGDRNYVPVEGWQAIALAHGCVGSSRDVENVPGGVRAIGQVRRMADGQIIAEAEGFVGQDEAVWFGGEAEGWKWGEKRGERVRAIVNHPKRADYAIRAMAQTRAISRACRAAFAHVVVMMNAGLSTTPAEEVPAGGFDDHQAQPQGEPRNVTPKTEPKAKAEPKTAAKSPAEASADTATAIVAELRATKTIDALEDWAEANVARINTLGPKAVDGVQLAYSRHRDDLAARDDEPAQETAKPEADPFAEDGQEQAQAETPKAPAKFTPAQSADFRKHAIDAIGKLKTKPALVEWNKAHAPGLASCQEDDFEAIREAWYARDQEIVAALQTDFTKAK